MKVYLNGQIQEKESASEVFEPGFLFGWGVFETLRSYKGKPAFLELHTQRLNKSLSVIGIEPPVIDWAGAIGGLIIENNLDDAYIRITAYKRRKATGLIIYADKFAYYGPATYEKGFTSITSPYRRDQKDQLSKLKAISYLENRISWHEAQKVKKDEALVLNAEGFLVGGSRSNIFLVKDGKVSTPLIEDGAFFGITREVVSEVLNDLNIESKEEKISMEDLFSCEEAFITSSLMEVMPLVECDGKLIGQGRPGEITLKILTEYRKLLI